jgi:methionine-rich copper-binding protein CopC
LPHRFTFVARCTAHVVRSAIPAILVVTLLTLFRPPPAAAHAILIASQPPQGGTVGAGKVAIHLKYNSRIDRARSRLTLTRPDHSQATLPIAAEGAPDEMDTAATLTPGAYVLRWQVLAIDGHITRGDVPFTVGP